MSQQTFSRIGVIGAGAWGTALANVAARAGADVVLWTRDPGHADEMARTCENQKRLPGVRLLPDRFMVIHQAMGMPAQRCTQAREHLNAFVEDAKRSGWVAEAFVRHGIKGAAVAE